MSSVGTGSLTLNTTSASAAINFNIGGTTKAYFTSALGMNCSINMNDSTGMSFYDNASTGHVFAVNNTWNSPATGSNYVIYTSQGTKSFYLNYANSSGVWSISSDVTLKKNIVPITSQLSNILALNPVSYRWKTQEDTDIPSMGFIAQDYQQVYPNDVSTDDKGILSANFGSLFPYLVKAIQEQQTEINALKAQVATLMH